MTWALKPLSEILDQSGRHRAGDQDLPVLSITMKHGLVDQADKFKKRIASADTSNYRIAYKNELVVGFPIDEGVLGFQTKYPAGIVSPAYGIWKLKSEADCHISYLERYLRSSQARSHYASRMQGAVARRRSLTKTDFLNLEVPFPPLDDQIRIAHLLGKVEGLIAQRKQHLQQLDDLLKSAFLEMFGDPVRNEKGWNAVFWDDLFVTRTGKLNANAMSENGAYPFFTCAKEIFQIDNFAFDCEALILAGNNATGDYDVKHYKGKFNAYQRTYILELKSETDKYSFYKHHLEMKLRQLKDGSKGANTRYLTKQFLDTISFIQPSEELQNRFSSIGEKIDRIKSRYQQSLTDLETLYGALSQQAFKGELGLSRVPMPGIQAEEEKTVAAEPLHTRAEQGLAINLPDTDKLLEALDNADAREGLISQWLEAYRGQLGGTVFSVQHFMAAAQTRLAELHPDNDFELVANDYEHIKTWMFKALADGRLQQSRDITGHDESGEPIFGNLIEVKSGARP